MDALNVGVRADVPVIRDVIRHEQTGLLVDPQGGVIYGRRGTPVGWVCADGYVRLGGNHAPWQYAHRLIWETVNGPIPDRLQVDHLNGRKSDNRLGNLELVTQSENVRRAFAKGLMPKGEGRPEARLTDALVQAIRFTAGSVSNAAWARALGVERSTVRCARIGKTWRHVAIESAGGRKTLPTRGSRRSSLSRQSPGGRAS